MPSGVSSIVSPLKFCQISLILSGLAIVSLNPGIDKHPSSNSNISYPSRISYSGFTNILGSFLSSERSITTSLICLSTCVAAKPIPLASYIVLSISWANFSRHLSNLVTFSATFLNLGSGNIKISNFLAIFKVFHYNFEIIIHLTI